MAVELTALARRLEQQGKHELARELDRLAFLRNTPESVSKTGRFFPLFKFTGMRYGETEINVLGLDDRTYNKVIGSLEKYNGIVFTTIEEVARYAEENGFINLTNSAKGKLLSKMSVFKGYVDGLRESRNITESTQSISIDYYEAQSYMINAFDSK